MPVHSRNLLVFATLAAAALLTWVLARNSGREATAPVARPGGEPQGYYLRNAVLYGFNDDGAIDFRVEAERVDHDSSESDIKLEDVRVEYAGPSGVAWLLTAFRSTMAPDRERLALQSFRLRAVAGTPGESEAESLVFEGRDLNLDLRERTVSTEQPVQSRKGRCESNARGLNVNLNTDTIVLLESETSCRRTPGPAPTAALVLALAAGSAIAQDDPAGRITKTCSRETGDLITYEHTCRDAVITDNESFRVEAGFISVKDERGLVFERIEWSLTEGVRIEFETAVMVAESASLVWGADGVLRSFDLVGSPTEFTDIIDGRANPIRVMAPRIVFDRESGTLKSPGAFQFLEDGADGNKGGGCDLTYWLEEKRWEIGSPACLSELSLAPTAAEDSDDELPDEP